MTILIKDPARRSRCEDLFSGLPLDVDRGPEIDHVVKHGRLFNVVSRSGTAPLLKNIRPDLGHFGLFLEVAMR